MLHCSLSLSLRIIGVDVVFCVIFMHSELVEKQLYKINPQRLLLSLLSSGFLSVVVAVCSAHGYWGDECVLACAGISAGRTSLHSDEKGSTQRPLVSMVNYEISLWAAEPWERLGSGLMWDQLEWCQIVTLCRIAASNAAGTFIALLVCVIAGLQAFLTIWLLLEANKSPQISVV